MQNAISQLDTRLFFLIFDLDRRTWLTRAFRFFSRSGDGYLYVLFLPLALATEPQTGLQVVLAGILAYGAELPLYHLIKRKTRRMRPFRSLPNVSWRIWPPDEYSFPSGHTAGAVIMATLVGTLFPWMSPLVILWSTGVGVSRVYLGVHYPSDVLAGATLGYTCARIGLFISSIIL